MEAGMEPLSLNKRDRAVVVGAAVVGGAVVGGGGGGCPTGGCPTGGGCPIDDDDDDDDSKYNSIATSIDPCDICKYCEAISTLTPVNSQNKGIVVAIAAAIAAI